MRLEATFNAVKGLIFRIKFRSHAKKNRLIFLVRSLNRSVYWCVPITTRYFCYLLLFSSHCVITWF